MSTRIRYIKTDNPNVLRSMRNFQIDGQSLSIYLDTGRMVFNIIDEESNNSLASGGKTKNLAVLKIQAKRALASLGVDFEEEVRPSRRKAVEAVTDDSEAI